VQDSGNGPCTAEEEAGYLQPPQGEGEACAETQRGRLFSDFSNWEASPGEISTFENHLIMLPHRGSIIRTDVLDRRSNAISRRSESMVEGVRTRGDLGLTFDLSPHEVASVLKSGTMIMEISEKLGDEPKSRVLQTYRKLLVENLDLPAQVVPEM
jgi:hypothetical protein